MDVVVDDVPSGDETGDETGDGANGLDLTPRTSAATRTARSGGGRKWPWLVVLLAIVLAIGFVVSHAISDATLFFYNADEAVAKQSELGAKRFRLQGTVEPGTTTRTADGVSFMVTFNGVAVPVHHVGDPPELFQDNIPVVLEGHWESSAPGAAFASDRILVKHSENYDAKNPDRIKQATQGGTVPNGSPAAKP